MVILCFVLILVTMGLLIFVTSRFVLRFEKIEMMLNEIIIKDIESEDIE